MAVDEVEKRITPSVDGYTSSVAPTFAVGEVRRQLLLEEKP
jgi:hypothetical protein